MGLDGIESHTNVRNNQQQHNLRTGENSGDISPTNAMPWRFFIRFFLRQYQTSIRIMAITVKEEVFSFSLRQHKNVTINQKRRGLIFSLCQRATCIVIYYRNQPDRKRFIFYPLPTRSQNIEAREVYFFSLQQYETISRLILGVCGGTARSGTTRSSPLVCGGIIRNFSAVRIYMACGGMYVILIPNVLARAVARLREDHGRRLAMRYHATAWLCR